MSGDNSSFAITVVHIFIVPATMFNKTTIMLIQILNEFGSFHFKS
jgi:hypothetical protein